MIVTIDRGNGIEEMDDSLLDKKTGEVNNETEYTTWTEYYLNGELVHRSAHVRLKQNVAAEGIAAEL